jgi:hypothetical protein
MQVAPIRVPVRNKIFIEREAQRLLDEYMADTGARIEGAIPVEEIARYHLCLQLEFADLHDLLDVPRSNGGPDILGAMFFEQCAVFIDDRLNPDAHPEQLGRFRFSLAHEVGHWRLHRDAMARRRAANPGRPAFVCRQSQSETIPVEWQAETFASYLLLPADRVKDGWRSQRGSEEAFAFDISSHGSARLRKLWFGLASDGEEARWLYARECAALFDELAADLAKVFAVSIPAMRVRLEGLKLLQRVRQRSVAAHM